MQPISALTRRSFLRKMGAASVGAWTFSYVKPGSVWGAPANSRLNIALLACGNRTRQLLPSIVGPGENVVAVCDVDPERVAQAKREAAKHGANGVQVANAKVYEDYRKLLETEKAVDAVIIASGQRWHVPMSKVAMAHGKHVFCEKPLAHSVAEAREIREIARGSKLVTQVGTQGGSTSAFRRSLEVIQAGVLGEIRDVHCWINRSFPPSVAIDLNPDPIPAGLNWDFWCGPSPLLPFKKYYPGHCLTWGRWLAFGDGHLADMGAHAINLPWRALQLGAPQRVTVTAAEPVKDSYPSATDFRWDFPARAQFPGVSVWWHDGAKAGPPVELGKELVSTYDKVPTNGVLFVGDKGLLCSDAWGAQGMVKLKGEPEARGVLVHEGCKSVPSTLPRAPKDHMQEFFEACKGGPPTFQGFASSADIAEVAMVGMVALRYGKPLEWDSVNLKAKGEPGADPLIHLPQRQKWL